MEIMVCLIMACLVAVSTAEPPVSRYLPPQGNNFGSNARSSFLPPESFGVPQGVSSSHDFLEERSKQSARNFHSAAFSPSFGARPLSKFSSPSQTYLPPQRFASNQEHGVPSLRSGLSQENQFPNPRNQPTKEYGLPSQHNGGFDHDNFGDNGKGRNAQKGDSPSSGPGNYGFQYAVNDDLHGTEFGHTESRHDEKAQGQYRVLLPDGRKRTVEYEADGAGFKPHISYEDEGREGALARSGYRGGPAGYDDNSKNLAINHHSKKSGKDISSGIYH